jgi:rod shape-determining protein MreC
MRQLTRRQRVAAITLAMLAVGFITLDLGGSSLQPAHSGVRGTLGALYRGTDAVLGPAKRFAQGLPSAGSNQGRVSRLRQQNAQLRGELAAVAADKSTAGQLATLRLAASAVGYAMLPARVIALGPGAGFDWTVTLDAGSRSGVKVGQSVTDGAGLVGRVLHADTSASVVLLAADPGSGVGARDLRTGEIGLATGAGAGGFSFVPLNPAADLRVGDQLATGPAGDTSFVPGLAIGTVSSVRTSADGTTRAGVRPATAPTTLDLLGVILAGSPSVAARSALPPGGSR